MNTNTPYANLSPDLIFDAIESVGFRCTSSLLALNSYENRVYQIGIEEAEPLIVKFYRPQRWSDTAILEEHQFSLELASHEIPVVAPLIISDHTLHKYQNYRFAIFPRKGGRVLELDNLEQLEWVGRFMGRIHAVGACHKFQHRLRLDVSSYGHTPYQFLVKNNFIPTELKNNFSHLMDALLPLIEQKFRQIEPLTYLRLHGDCHAGNILWNNDGPQFVDLDDCLMGPAIQDIWMLLSGNEDDVNLQLERIFQGYQKFHDFNFNETNLIEALRTLRMIHYAAWLANRWQDPAFPLNFPWFNTPRYWENFLNDLREQHLKLNG